MNTPSRNMPAAPVRKAPPWAWLLLAALLVGLAYWFFQRPYVVAGLLVALGVLVGIQFARDKRSRRRLVAARQEESICEFVRSFDRRTDTWVIRAVYEEVSRFLPVDGRTVPVRRHDLCEKDLGIVPEDLDDIARDVAFRARRSMEHCDQNPLYGKVQTVGDMVTFLEYQPRIAEPSALPNGGPAAPLGHPNVPGGPPSVS